jgi:pimeloyl-ACP methyl ester carboxylesterase
MTACSRLLEIAGGRRTIEVFEAGDGDPLVFLHGEGGLAADSPFLAALARGRHVVAPLLPGYGLSSGAETLRDMLAVTLHSFDVLDALGLDRPVLVGHSMGGMIAAEMAALAPREVERLGLVAPAGLWLDAHPVPDLFSTLPRDLPALLFHDPECGERILTAGRDLDDPKFLEAFVIGNARQLAMASKLLFPLPDRGLAERLYRIRAKTVIIWGEADRLIPPAYGEAFCRGIAGAELITVPSAGHMVIVEQPAAVVAALARLGRPQARVPDR